MLRAAAAQIDVTPPTPCPLAGFGERSGPFVGVFSRLEANAIAFRDPTGRCAVLLTLDTLFVGPTLHAALTQHFVSRHGQNARDLMILASHTHFAPSLDLTKPVLGMVDHGYLDFAIERCRTLLDRILADAGTSARIERRTGASRAAINRRRRWPFPHFYARRLVGPQTVMAPNPRGLTDPTVTTFAIVAESGEAVALIWHYACHPTAFPQPLHVSADFPGVVRSRLRKRHGADLPVLFLQGFAGDLRPNVPESRPATRRAFNCLLSGPSFASFTFEGWQHWSEAMASDVLAAFEEASATPSRPAAESLAIGSASNSIPLGLVMTEGQGEREVGFQRLRLSADLDIVAVAAEPLTGLRALVPIEGALATGYLGDVFGYWPTDRDALDGGYEVNHFLAAFGLQGRLRHPLDALFRDAIDGLRRLQ